jgi:hypothetical protein
MLNAVVYLGCFVTIVLAGMWRLARKLSGF